MILDVIEIEKSEKALAHNLKWRTIIICSICGVVGSILILNEAFGGIALIIVAVGVLIQYPYFKNSSDKRMKRIKELKDLDNLK